MKIYAPVRDFNGLRNNVRFVNGVGETDNMVIVSWFQSHGYYVEDESHIATVEKSLEKCDELLEKLLEKCDETTEPDFEAMTPNQLRDWMKENGYGSKIKNTRDKEKLLKILRG